MCEADEPTAEERAIVLLVARLREGGDIAPLLALLQDERDGRERVRAALTVLAELDPELIAQVALDALIQARRRSRRL